jgi:uncharacterized membrane protein YphA (DoxX/SURF4 family)
MSGSSRFAFLSLRVGTAFAFLYPPIKAITDPISWIGYFPSFIQRLPIPSMVLLHGFGLVEVVIAVWILSGWKIRIPAAVATLMLLAIVVFNASQMDVVFRDLSIACMTLALALMPSFPKPSAADSAPR